MNAQTEVLELFEAEESQQSARAADLFFDTLMGRSIARRWVEDDEGAALETPSPSSVAPIAIPARFRMGVWVDVGGRSLRAHGARHAALLHELGFSDACIMINQVESTRFAFDAVSEEAMRGFAALLADSGTRLTLTSWLRPDKDFMDDLVRLLPPLAVDIGALAIELDVESTWRSGRVRGFAGHAEAADYFFRALRGASGSLEIAVTCEVDPMTHASMVPVLRAADIVVPQAYSAHGAQRSHQVGGVYGPRGLQDRAVQRLGEALQLSGKPAIMGLAAMGRAAWSGHSANAIMRMELKQTLALRTGAAITGARYWSWKHIAGNDARGGGEHATSYGVDFFRRSVRSAGPASAWAPSPGALPPRATTPTTVAPSSSSLALPVGATSKASAATEVIELDPVRTPARDLSWNDPQPRGPAPSPAGRAGRTRVLQSVRVELPLTRQRIQAAKLYDPARDATSLRAVGSTGAPVDLAASIEAETRTWLGRYRQIHPALARAIDPLGPDEQIPILAWIFHEHELARKDEAESRPPLLVASREAAALPGAARAPREPVEDSYSEALRASLRPVLERAISQFRGVGVEATASLGTVPVLAARATKAQIQALSRLPEVTGLYLHETRGIPDLSDSIADARAAAAHTGGFKGANVRAAVWEATPASVSQLAIEETFDSTVAATQSAGDRSHAQLVTAVIKNTQSAGPKGFAPDCKIYSANKYDNDALAWAITTKRCTVLNQSFHYPSEETDPGLSAVDLIADYLVVHPPFTTIVQAAGNGPATEYVNHKGFNTTRVGNHVDGAASMDSQSAFKNPASTHSDRELPDLSANGTSVAATGVTMSGTSFASPAVAGTAAVVQSVDATLKTWPEGCRAILLASAGRNITGGTWRQAAGSATADGIDGSGALDTHEAVRIARVRAARGGAAVHRGWDVGRLTSSDFQASGTSTFRYAVQVPASGARRLKVALAWSSKITYTTDAAVTPPVKVTESKLTVDLDLYVYLANTLVAHSSTFDNSFEIVEFDAVAGSSYDIRIRRFSGTDWVWFGLAWTVL